MAQVADSGPAVGVSRFRMVTRAPRIVRGHWARNPSAAVVHPSGVTVLNVTAAELFTRLALEAGLDPKEFAVVFGGDVVKRQVGCWMVDAKTLGATAVRRRARRGMTLYLSAVFADMPDLRPTSLQSCVVTEATEEGSHFAVIALGVALDRVRTRRRAMAPLAPAGA